MFSYSASGFGASIAGLFGYTAAAKKHLELAMKKCVEIVESYAKKEVPVLSGKLKDSIAGFVEWQTATMVKGEVQSGSKEAYYAFFVHAGLGKGNRTPNPYMQRALDKAYPQIKKLLGSALRKAGVEASIYKD